jgi:predicted PurR-regulated permease PerM
MQHKLIFLLFGFFTVVVIKLINKTATNYIRQQQFLFSRDHSSSSSVTSHQASRKSKLQLLFPSNMDNQELQQSVAAASALQSSFSLVVQSVMYGASHTASIIPYYRMYSLYISE